MTNFGGLVFLMSMLMPAVDQANSCESVGNEAICAPALTGNFLFDNINHDEYLHRLEAARMRYEKSELLKQRERQKDVELQKLVGDLISRNDCPAAYRIALQAGNLDLAERVKSLCGENTILH